MNIPQTERAAFVQWVDDYVKKFGTNPALEDVWFARAERTAPNTLSDEEIVNYWLNTPRGMSLHKYHGVLVFARVILAANAGEPAAIFVLRALLAAGHVSQDKVDEAFAIAANTPGVDDSAPPTREINELQAEIERLTAMLHAIPANEVAPVARQVTVARMGRGAVAYGGCVSDETGEPGIIFMALDEPREIGADTTDEFPVGTPAPTEKVLACISFANAGAVDNVIEALNELREKHWPSTAAPRTVNS